MRVAVRLGFGLLIAACAFLPATAKAVDQEIVQGAPGYKPLTSDERWNLFLDRSVLSPGIYFASVGSAVGSQVFNDPPEWEQGFSGYGKRVASAYGGFMIQSSVTHGMAAALHYEPRYVRAKGTRILPRFGHAVAWSLVTYDDKERIRPNIPVFAGAYASGMLSMYWYPSRYNPLTDGVRIGSQQIAWAAGANVVREFAPELKRLLHRK